MTGGRAIVTGASSGIGMAVALELARRGMDVVGSARRADPFADIDIGEVTGTLHSYRADLTDPLAVRDLFDYAQAKSGPIDTVVHSVGHEYPITMLADSDRSAVPGAIGALVTSPTLVLSEALARFDSARG